MQQMGWEWVKTNMVTAQPLNFKKLPWWGGFLQDMCVLFNLLCYIKVMIDTVNTQAHYHSFPFLYISLLYAYRTANQTAIIWEQI